MSKVIKKRILPFMLVISMLLSVVYISANAVMLGDLNSDGKVKANDARVILRVAAELENIADELNAVADVNGDGKIKANDARIVLRVAAEIETFATIESTTALTTQPATGGGSVLSKIRPTRPSGVVTTRDNNTTTSTDPMTTIPPTDPLTTIPPTDPMTTIPPTVPQPTTPPTDPLTTIPPTVPQPTTPPTDPLTTIPPTDPMTTIPPTVPQPTIPPTDPQPTIPPTTEAGNPYDDIVYLSKYYVKATVNEGGVDSMVETATDGKSMFVRTNMLTTSSGNSDAGVLVKAENTSLLKLDKGVYLIDYKAKKALFLSQIMIDSFSAFSGEEDFNISSFAGEMDEIKLPKFVSFEKMTVTEQVVGDETMNFVSLVNDEGIKTDYYFRGSSQIPCIIKSYNKDGIVVSEMTIHDVSENPAPYLSAPDMEIISMTNISEALTFLENMGLVG